MMITLFAAAEKKSTVTRSQRSSKGATLMAKTTSAMLATRQNSGNQIMLKEMHPGKKQTVETYIEKFKDWFGLNLKEEELALDLFYLAWRSSGHYEFILRVIKSLNPGNREDVANYFFDKNKESILIEMAISSKGAEFFKKFAVLANEKRLSQRVLKLISRAKERKEEKCALTYYKGSNFIGRKVICDVRFEDSLKTVNKFAAKRGVKIYVTSSFRTVGAKLRGAIVEPASCSNHLAGHGIDMNVRYNGILYNSKALKKSNLNNLPPSVRGFIQDIRDNANLRWGGDFNDEDPVHIDDHLNKDNSAWKARYVVTQQAYRNKCL